MPAIQKIISVSFMFLMCLGFSQTVEISGVVNSIDDVENIHVLNNAENAYTITNAKGEFKIKAKLNDTILFSSVQHQIKQVVVDKQMILFKAMRVVLEEQITHLDEVVLGKVLTGNLLSDINNMEVKETINFYDVGIPGYTGRKKTQNERRLESSKPSLTNPVDLINVFSGRIKKLKKIIVHEESEALMQNIKARLASDFFRSNPLEEEFRMDFFYFCADDPTFVGRCKNQTDFKILLFLRTKYEEYMKNRGEENN